MPGELVRWRHYVYGLPLVGVRLLLWSPAHIHRLLDLAERARRVVIGTGYLTLNPLLLRLAGRAATAGVCVVASIGGADRTAAEALASAGARVGFVPSTAGGGMFHAKDRAVVLVGSGNLTGAALTPGGNTEIFTELDVDVAAIDALEAQLWSFVTLTDPAKLPGRAPRYAAGGDGSAARLLGAVRPDIYVVLNRASIARINQVIDDPFPTPDNTPANRRRYEDLLARVQAAPWWRAPRPSTGLEVWEGRALLLDTFFYDASVG